MARRQCATPASRNSTDCGTSPAIQAGRVWTNCYHAYPALATFGDYKQPGVGRENHKMMLDHYHHTKNMLVSYSAKKARLLLIGALNGGGTAHRAANV